MKKTLLILTFILLSILGFSQLDFYIGIDENKTDSMSRAWYPFHLVDSLRFENEKFLIAKSNIKPEKLISKVEKLSRDMAGLKPTSKERFNKFNSDEFKTYEDYLISHRKDSLMYDSVANQEHKYYNSLPMAVWIQNYSNDTIVFPTQDASLIAILEAKDKRNKWRPIEYWWYSWCGNSYMDLILPPKNSIQIGINNLKGNIKTKMRFKIHGQDTIFISKSFRGTVSESDFLINNMTKKEMVDDEDRVSFLDSIIYGLTDFPLPEMAPIDEEK